MAAIGLNMPTPSTERTKRGFSLVELLVAMMIFAIGLLGLAALQTMSIAQGTGGRQRGTAAILAHSIMDRIQAEGSVTASERWDAGTVTSTTGWTFIGAGGGTEGNSGTTPLKFDIEGNPLPSDASQSVFQVAWVRKAVATAGAASATQEFVVNVTWQESNSQTKGISVSRYVRI